MGRSIARMAEDNNEQSVQDFLRILEEHRAECEAQGKYVEAEIAKKRLDELHEHEENRQKEAMRSRQITERLGVEEAHMMEFQQFNEMLQKSQPYRPKFSKELLNTRKIQETLAKMKQYSEAHKIKLKADGLEEIELEKLRSQHAHKLAAQEMQFAQRQQLELATLMKRVDTAEQEHKIQRQQDLERLLQRYQNVKAELEAQQNLERCRYDKYKGTSAMFTTYSSVSQTQGMSQTGKSSRSRTKGRATPRKSLA